MDKNKIPIDRFVFFDFTEEEKEEIRQMNTVEELKDALKRFQIEYNYDDKNFKRCNNSNESKEEVKE